MQVNQWISQIYLLLVGLKSHASCAGGHGAGINGGNPTSSLLAAPTTTTTTTVTSTGMYLTATRPSSVSRGSASGNRLSGTSLDGYLRAQVSIRVCVYVHV